MAADDYFFPTTDLQQITDVNSYFKGGGDFGQDQYSGSYNPGSYTPGSYAGAYQTDLGPNAGSAYTAPNLYDPATEEYFNSNLRMSPNPNVYGTTNDPYSAEMPAGNFGAAANSGISNNAGSWLENLYNSYLGPNTALGGRSGAFTGGGSGGMGAGGQGWLPALMSIGSGIYGMTQANEQRRLAQQAIAGSSPWTSSGGAAGAGTALTNVIQGDFTNDPGYKAALQAAARTSSQQPGGFAAMAAAQAALKYQNDRIQALGPAAGVGFSPGTGYQTALGGMTSANDLASRSLGTIGYGVTGTQPMSAELQAFLIRNRMGVGNG